MAGVDHVRPELANMLPKYEKIDDACSGEEAIKSKGVRYLPAPKAESVGSKEYEDRYSDYILRAQYINFSGRTVEALSGLIFSKSIAYQLPTLCEVVKANADGSGVSLEQQAKVIVQHVLKKGRCGVFIDYPTRDTAATRAELESGDVRPVVLAYQAESIINWDTGVKGSKNYFTLIVLKEWYSERSGNDFEVKVKEQYRVLELVDANGTRYGEKIGEGARYCQTIYRKPEATSNAIMVEIVDPNVPNLGQLNECGFRAGVRNYVKDAQGKFLTEIPFMFVGAISNDASIDKPPMLDIVNVNIGHYRNSADHEDSCFMVGQPTPVVSGITDKWYKDVLGGRLTLGSRATIPLPPNASVTLVQADPNTMAKEAMIAKEKQMIQLGAKMIEEGAVSKTATEDTNDNIAENSVLGNVASNVEAALKYGLEWCAIFTGEVTQDQDATSRKVSITLNKKFNTHGSTAAERAQLLKEWMADAISKTEYRSNLRKAGIDLDNDDEADKEIEREQKLQLEYETERNKALAAAAVGNQPGGGVNSKPKPMEI